MVHHQRRPALYSAQLGVTCHTPSRRSSAASSRAPQRSALTGTRTPWCTIKTPAAVPETAREHSGSFNRMDFTGDNVGALLDLSSGIVLAGLLEEDDVVPEHRLNGLGILIFEEVAVHVLSRRP